MMVVSTTYLFGYGETEVIDREMKIYMVVSVFVIIAVLIIQYYIIESAVLSAMKKHDKNKQKVASENTDNNG